MANTEDGKNEPKDMERYFSDPAYRRGKPGGGQRRRLSRRTVQMMVVLALSGVLCIAFGVYLFSGLPSLERIENPRTELATRVFSVDGEVLDQYYIKNRSHSSLQEIPQTVIHALIATEDKDFYSHWGVDVIRFCKAMVKNALAFRLKEGASTITQQLSRNLYLGHDDRNVFDTVTRKMREFITAIQLERSFTKEEILEFYLNVVYFGRGAYGVASASHVYSARRRRNSHSASPRH
jgi:penicillin-binding protein 1A